MQQKKIILTVFNDLSYDQRMIRICSSLSAHYHVLLVGKKLRNSVPLQQKSYVQRRLSSWFYKGKLSYIEYNLRLFFFLLFRRSDAICAIDLDTILPCYFVSVIKRVTRIYDAHELFCEMKEVVERPAIYKSWKLIEKFSVPKFRYGYTVNDIISNEFFKMYAVHYEVVRNVPLLRQLKPSEKKEKYILYQGAVNEGRSFETLIPAMQWVNAPLHIYGDGNFLEKAKELVRNNHLEDKIIFKGKVLPVDLAAVTAGAYIGVTLFDKTGESNYFSLANRFFDYMQSGIPQLCVDYPVYRDINEKHPVALLIDDLSSHKIAEALNNLLTNDVLYDELSENCWKARTIYNWQNEEKILIAFYDKILK